MIGILVFVLMMITVVRGRLHCRPMIDTEYQFNDAVFANTELNQY